MSYETIIVETRGKVGLITLHRPQALNALNATLLREVNQALDGFDSNRRVGLHRHHRFRKGICRRRRH